MNDIDIASAIMDIAETDFDKAKKLLFAWSKARKAQTLTIVIPKEVFDSIQVTK